MPSWPGGYRWPIRRGRVQDSNWPRFLHHGPDGWWTEAASSGLANASRSRIRRPAAPSVPLLVFGSFRACVPVAWPADPCDWVPRPIVPVLLRELTGRAQNQVGDRVIVVCNGLAAEASCLQGESRRRRQTDRGQPAPRRRSPAAPTRERSCSTACPCSLAGSLVSHLTRAAVIQHLSWWWLLGVLASLEGQPFGRPLGDERQQSVARGIRNLLVLYGRYGSGVGDRFCHASSFSARAAGHP